MAKDPAFLFYPGDWQGGTMTMTRHLKGCYLDLLVAQFNSGPLSLEEIKVVLGADFGTAWPTLSKKFKAANGLYSNERLETEKAKRSEYSQKQKDRINKRWNKDGTQSGNTAVLPIENENRNEVVNEGLEERVKGEKPVPRESNFKLNWALAFDDITLENYRMNFRQINVDDELKHFRLKCDSAKEDYYVREPAGLRLAFLAQLKTAKPKVQERQTEYQRKREALRNA